MGKEHRRGHEFNKPTKREAKEEAGYLCSICGSPDHLEVHHKVPIRDGGSNEPHNALCTCSACHEVLDQLALQEGKYYPEVLMEPGVDYIIEKSKKYRKPDGEESS